MKEIRDIKIDLVMGNKNPIIERFMEITKDLCIIKCDVYHKDGLEFIYHNKDGEWIFYQDCKNEKFWTHYYRYWEILEREFHLEYEEIQALTKFLVEEALKREVGTPTSNGILNESQVEEALKQELTTPYSISNNLSKVLEKVLKRELSTPTTKLLGKIQKVEDVLNRELGTPVSPIGNIVAIEEALKQKL
jgi:hypothetical protein